MQMYQRPFPVPVPVPLPIPVPVFIPTTRNSTRGVKKFLKKMKSKMPTNVFEAQILEMAGAMEGNEDLDSDDSLYEEAYDHDEDDGAAATGGRHAEPVKPTMPSEDVEKIIKAGHIVPKPLPQVTPDACPSPGPFGYRLQQRSPTPKGIPGLKLSEIILK